MDWWPSWLRPKLPLFSKLSARSSLDPLLYILSFLLILTFCSAAFTDKTLLIFLMTLTGFFGAIFAFGYCYFAFHDPDRLSPPADQRHYRKLMYDERRNRATIIDAEPTANTSRPDVVRIPHHGP